MALYTLPCLPAASMLPRSSTFLVEYRRRYSRPSLKRRPAMTIHLHADPAPLRVDDTGAIRVGQSRVTLDALLQYRRLGMTPEEIAHGLDTLMTSTSTSCSDICSGLVRSPFLCRN